MKANSHLFKHALTAVAAAALLYTVGCYQSEGAKDYGDPTRLDSLTIQSDIWAQFIEPSDPRVTGAPQTTVVLHAWTEGRTLPLIVEGGHALSGRVAAAIEGEPGPTQRFSFPVDLVHGPNIVTAAILQDTEGLRRVASYSLDYQGIAPGLIITGVNAAPTEVCPEAPARTTFRSTSVDHVCIYGHASAAPNTELTSIAAETPEGRHAISNPGTSFRIRVPLKPDTLNEVRVRATDAQGESSERTLTVEHNAQAPTLTITHPADAYMRTSDATIEVRGSAQDDSGLDRLQIFAGTTLIGNLPATEDFSFDLQLHVGLNTIRVVLTDIAGNESEQSFEVFRDRISTLNASIGRGGETLLQLDKSALSELLDVDAQKELILAGVGLRPFLYGAIAAIRDPYAFGNDPEDFGQAEYNFYRLLNLSADTADLRGTSLGELSELAYAIGLPTARILAELLNLEVDEPALATDLIVDVLLENLIMSHPEVVVDDAGDPILEIRLYDALNDLRPLAERFGPVASTGHPGIIGGSIFAEVLEPGFLLSARAISHLIPFEGIDAARGSKDFIYIREGDKVLSLDVYDENTFSVVGIVDEPLVDVTFSLNEHPQFVAAGTQRTANPDPERPGAYKGDNIGWTLKPWILERIVLDIVYRRFVNAYPETNFQSRLIYNAGSIIDAVDFVWNRGWFTTATAGGLGEPPAPQYVWDALSELAQVRLHDGGLAEGDANARFALSNVPVGVDADGLVDAIRPALDSQQDRLSEILLGDGGISASDADFYYVETLPSSAALLYFRHASDNATSAVFPRPGFFRDAALTERADTTSSLGTKENTTHYKVAAAAGDRFYFADESDQVFRLDIVAVRSRQVDLIVTEEGAP